MWVKKRDPGSGKRISPSFFLSTPGSLLGILEPRAAPPQATAPAPLSSRPRPGAAQPLVCGRRQQRQLRRHEAAGRRRPAWRGQGGADPRAEPARHLALLGRLFRPATSRAAAGRRRAVGTRARANHSVSEGSRQSAAELVYLGVLGPGYKQHCVRPPLCLRCLRGELACRPDPSVRCLCCVC